MIYFFVFIIAICWLIYELLLSTLSSYLVWNSIMQFSLTIWLFLSGMWVGSYLSRYIREFYKSFFVIETLLWVIWWFSVILIKFFYIYFVDYFVLFYVFYFAIVLIIWIFVWLEIPLLAAILQKNKKYEDPELGVKWLISDIFTYDYIGALIATFLFPFLMLPWLGLTYTALLLGFFNLFVSFLFLLVTDVKINMQKIWYYKKAFVTIIVVMFGYIVWWMLINNYFEKVWYHFYYKEPIVAIQQSTFQEIVLTKRGDDIRLFLDGFLQFVSLDEERYHDWLWYAWNQLIEAHIWEKDWNILILWWWDWLLARTILQTLKWKNNFHITIVDIDPEMTKFSQTNKLMIELNWWSLRHKNVTIINDDAFAYIKNYKDKKYDIIMADFPDPRNVALSKLYSQEMYLMLANIFDQNWVFVTQAWNAFFAKEAYWSIHKTIQSVFKDKLNMQIVPYHVYIPSFGDWWFVATIPSNLKLKKTNWFVIFSFDNDYIPDGETKVSTLENPTVIYYYLQGRDRFKL